MEPPGQVSPWFRNLPNHMSGQKLGVRDHVASQSCVCIFIVAQGICRTGHKLLQALKLEPFEAQTAYQQPKRKDLRNQLLPDVMGCRGSKKCDESKIAARRRSSLLSMPWIQRHLEKIGKAKAFQKVIGLIHPHTSL